MARAITRCPNCGSSVSQFAAGCAICGENLSVARQDLRRRREARPSLTAPSWLPEITAADAVLGAILIVAAFGSPILGGPIAALFAYFAHQRGDIAQRNLALVAVAVAVLVVFLISFLPDTGGLLFPWVDLSGPLPTN
jgi:H+/Cl- antiporter ClcA